MPIHKVEGGYRWGAHGTVYPNREGAEEQARAAYANGYTGDETLEEAIGDRRQVKDFAGYYAPEKIGKSRRLTPEGWLVLEGTPIARTGEQLYAAHELEGIEPNAQGYIVVERRAEHVFRPESLGSLEGKDYVIEHPPEGVDIDNWKNHTVGHVQNVRRGTGIEDDLVLADIFVKDPMAIAYVNKHLPENSVGYSADYEQIEPGRALQKNIIGNHVAGVMAGRAGARVAVRDHSISGDSDMDRKTFGQLIKERLVKLGVRSADADTLSAELQDVTITTRDTEGGETEVMKRLEGMDAVLKKVSDWQMARDAKEEAEAKERKEAADKAMRDAEEQERKRKEGGEASEETGDTILEAEGTGKVINLGKTWTGGMTGDSAEPVLTGVISRAEVLAPGIPKPTAEQIRGNRGVALAGFMRTALERHSTADAAGKENVATFLLGRKVADLKGMDLVAVFNGASQLARARNNRSTADGTMGRRPHVGAFTAPKPISDINAANRKFWADRKS